MKIPRKTLSIDFGSKTIKVIEGKHTKDKLQILKAITIEAPPKSYKNGKVLDKAKLAKAISNQLVENKIRTTTTHAIINSSEVLIREIIIPKVPDKDIKSVVDYQVADYLPINVEDYAVQYVSQGNIFDGDAEKIKILLLAIPKEIISSHLSLLKSIGLRPEVLDHQGNAMAKLLEFNNVVNEDYPLENIAVASIDIGYSSTKITITKNGLVEVTKVIDFGVQTLHNNISSFFEYSIKEVEEKLKTIGSLEKIKEDEFSDDARFANIIRSGFIALFEKIEAVTRYHDTREVGNVLGAIVLQGGLSNVPDLDQMFSTYFNVPAMQLSSLDRIPWDGDLSSYATAIGGLIRMDVV